MGMAGEYVVVCCAQLKAFHRGCLVSGALTIVLDVTYSMVSLPENAIRNHAVSSAMMHR
jgi:hypothetical protein